MNVLEPVVRKYTIPQDPKNPDRPLRNGEYGPLIELNRLAHQDRFEITDQTLIDSEIGLYITSLHNWHWRRLKVGDEIEISTRMLGQDKNNIYMHHILSILNEADDTARVVNTALVASGFVDLGRGGILSTRAATGKNEHLGHLLEQFPAVRFSRDFRKIRRAARAPSPDNPIEASGTSTVTIESMDVNGHYNNAKYFDLIGQMGETLQGLNHLSDKVLEGRGLKFFVSASSLFFPQELIMGDQIQTRCTMVGHHDSTVYMQHEITKGDKPANFGICESVLLDTYTGKPLPLKNAGPRLNTLRVAMERVPYNKGLRQEYRTLRRRFAA